MFGQIANESQAKSIGALYFFKSGIGSCIAPKAGLACPPANGRYCFLVFRRFCCPGPGSSWGNPAVLPANKEAKSPSN